MAVKLMYGMTAAQIIEKAPDWATHVSCGHYRGVPSLLYESAGFFQAYNDLGRGGVVEQPHGQGIVPTALALNKLLQLKELPDESKES